MILIRWKNLVFSFRNIGMFLIGVFSVFLLGCTGEQNYEQRNALGKVVIDEFIQQRFCANYSDCEKKEAIYGDSDSKQVQLNLYGIQDRALISAIFARVVNEGMKATRGVPFAISVFSEPKTKHLGIKRPFGLDHPAIKLEVNE